MRVATTLALAVGLAGWPGETLYAQGFGFLFGQPERGYGTRMARRPRPRVAAIPLPVPRPHFPEDEPRIEAAAPERAVPAPPAAAPAPIAGVGAATPVSPPRAGMDPTFPPLPPEKPAALTVPSDAKPSNDKTPEPKPSRVEHSKAAGTTTSKTKVNELNVNEPKVAQPNVDAPKLDAAKPPGPEPIDNKAPPLPAVAPSGATNAFNPRQPSEDAACPGRLKATHVEAAAINPGPQPDARCVVQQAVKLDHLTLPDGTRISFPDRPTLACVTADTFATYVRDLLVPLAKGTYGVSLESVWTGPGLECRSRDHIFGAKLSAHGQGLAIDIAHLKLGDGRMLAVGDPKNDLDKAFESAARAAGCGYFHTVLGPGSDSYHRTHWHFDLEERGSKGDGKFCK